MPLQCECIFVSGGYTLVAIEMNDVEFWVRITNEKMISKETEIKKIRASLYWKK